MRSEYAGQGRETWTGGCSANDLSENKKHPSGNIRKPCLREECVTLTLLWRQGRRLGQRAGGGGVQDPLSVLIIG